VAEQEDQTFFAIDFANVHDEPFASVRVGSSGSGSSVGHFSGSTCGGL
jgi:hypothetical protein